MGMACAMFMSSKGVGGAPDASMDDAVRPGRGMSLVVDIMMLSLSSTGPETLKVEVSIHRLRLQVNNPSSRPSALSLPTGSCAEATAHRYIEWHMYTRYQTPPSFVTCFVANVSSVGFVADTVYRAAPPTIFVRSAVPVSSSRRGSHGSTNHC